jgi:hypothetical protein
MERENEFKPIQEQLKRALEHAEVRNLDSDAEALEGMQVFEIVITDKEGWGSEQEAEKLVDFFGDAVVRIYDDRDGSEVYDGNDPAERSRVLTENISNADIGRADRIVVIADQNNRLVSFLATETYNYADEPDLPSVSYISLVYTDPNHRNKGICQELLCQTFKEEDAQAFGCITATPAMAKSYLEASKRMGLDFYFAGHKDGSLDEPTLPDQLKKFEIFNKKLDELDEEDGVLAEGSISPQGYQIFDRESSMAPVEPGDLRFKSDDPLDRLFREELLPIQQKNLPNTVYGIALSLRR